MKNFLRQNAVDLVTGAGALLLVIGFGMVYLPLAPIVAGIALLSVGVLMARQDQPPKSQE